MNELQWDIGVRRSVVPASLGGDGRSKALALLGDRLLDIVLYEILLKAGHTDEGIMTQHRSMSVANKNLAHCVEELLIPAVISPREFEILSAHEKGTVMEAFLGLMYERDNYTLSDRVRRYVSETLDVLRANVADADVDATEFRAITSIKKAKSALLELLQKRGITNGSTFFSITSFGANSTLPPFISTFEPSFSLGCCGLPDTGAIHSDKCDSKKEAEENCSRKVLDFFRGAEVVAKLNGEVDANGASENAPAVGTAMTASSVLAELEEGEDAEIDDVIKKKQEFGELIRKEIQEVRKRVAKKKEEKYKKFLQRNKQKAVRNKVNDFYGPSSVKNDHHMDRKRQRSPSPNRRVKPDGGRPDKEWSALPGADRKRQRSPSPNRRDRPNGGRSDKEWSAPPGNNRISSPPHRSQKRSGAPPSPGRGQREHEGLSQSHGRDIYYNGRR